MSRLRLQKDRVLNATERVQRYRRRRGEHRLKVLFDLTSFDQVSWFAERWVDFDRPPAMVPPLGGR